MVKLTKFEVQIEGGKDLFRPGDWIQGHVVIYLAQAKKHLRGVQVKCQGHCKTYWTREESRSCVKQIKVPYWSKERYFKDRILLLGKDCDDRSGETIGLNAGEHHLPFRFQLPDKPMPHAFEGKYGYVRYSVIAKIDRQWKFNHFAEKRFHIVGPPVDIHAIPGSDIPSRCEKERTVCCLCCVTGPIEYSAETNKSCYVPGEIIWVSGFVANNSSHVTAKLVQKAHFRAKRRGKFAERHRLSTRTVQIPRIKGCVGCHDTSANNRKAIGLLVPSIPPSGLPYCDFINIEYSIKFEAGVSGLPKDIIRFDIPITIGTAPHSEAESPSNSSQDDTKLCALTNSTEYSPEGSSPPERTPVVEPDPPSWTLA